MKTRFYGNCYTNALLHKAGGTHEAWLLTKTPGALAARWGSVKTLYIVYGPVLFLHFVGDGVSSF